MRLRPVAASHASAAISGWERGEVAAVVPLEEWGALMRRHYKNFNCCALSQKASPEFLAPMILVYPASAC